LDGRRRAGLVLSDPREPSALTQCIQQKRADSSEPALLCFRDGWVA
jgi:hypothetical protein